MASHYMQPVQPYHQEHHNGNTSFAGIGTRAVGVRGGYAQAPPPPPAPVRRFVPPPPAPRRASPPNTLPDFQAPIGYGQPPAHRVSPPARPPHEVPTRQPDPPTEPQYIKCSSCSEQVEVEQLGDHVCQAGRNLRSLRVDVAMDQNQDWNGARAGSATLRVTNPDNEGPHGFEPPRRSPAPNSAASSSRLPFFERYQQRLETSGNNNEAAAAAGQTGSAIPRSPRLALANLAPPSPDGRRSPQPAMPTSRSEPLLSIPAAASAYPARQGSLPSGNQAPDGRFPLSAQPSPEDPPTPPKTRTRAELVESTYLAYAALDDSDDEEPPPREPAQVSYPSRGIPQSRSSPAGLSNTVANLDACLADLQLLADDSAHVKEEEGPAGLMLRGFDTSLEDSRSAAIRHPTPRTRSPTSTTKRLPPSSARACTNCRVVLLDASDLRRAGDGQPFCRACFAERYLPKCRKCREPIEGGAVSSSDGKITGKYHSECFRCFECAASFPDGEFYVYDGKPYCQHDYHALNGSLCAADACGKPVEGGCVSLAGEENGNGGRYHPACFVCCERSCRLPLLDYHFILGGRPYCESHSSPPDASYSSSTYSERAKKRQTLLTRL